VSLNSFCGASSKGQRRDATYRPDQAALAAAFGFGGPERNQFVNPFPAPSQKVREFAVRIPGSDRNRAADSVAFCRKNLLNNVVCVCVKDTGSKRKSLKGVSMKQAIILSGMIMLILACAAYADYLVQDEGTWPKSWPKELELLRKQARTLEGPLVPLLHYAVVFSDRDAFESAWPHFLKVKSPGAPIVLRRAPSFCLGDEAKAGICIHTPPNGKAAITDVKKVAGRLEHTIYIELIVDGQIVDLNRIPLPKDTPIIDERFKEGISKR